MSKPRTASRNRPFWERLCKVVHTTQSRLWKTFNFRLSEARFELKKPIFRINPEPRLVGALLATVEGERSFTRAKVGPCRSARPDRRSSYKFFRVDCRRPILGCSGTGSSCVARRRFGWFGCPDSTPLERLIFPLHFPVPRAPSAFLFTSFAASLVTMSRKYW